MGPIWGMITEWLGGWYIAMCIDCSWCVFRVEYLSVFVFNILCVVFTMQFVPTICYQYSEGLQFKSCAWRGIWLDIYIWRYTTISTCWCRLHLQKNTVVSISTNIATFYDYNDNINNTYIYIYFSMFIGWMCVCTRPLPVYVHGVAQRDPERK